MKNKILFQIEELRQYFSFKKLFKIPRINIGN